MSAACAGAAASTIKAVVKEPFHRGSPGPMLHHLPRAAAPMFSPAATRTSQAGARMTPACVLVLSLGRPLEISCDPFVPAEGKSTPRGTRVRHLTTHLYAKGGYAVAAACDFTPASTRPRCCPNAPARARP